MAKDKNNEYADSNEGFVNFTSTFSDDGIEKIFLFKGEEYMRFNGESKELQLNVNSVKIIPMTSLLINPRPNRRRKP